MNGLDRDAESLTERGEGSSLYEQHCGSEKSFVQRVKEVPYEVQVLQYTNITQCLFTT